MNFREYMFFNKITYKQAAKYIKCSPSYLGLLARGQTHPSYEIMKKIYHFTKGNVTPNDMFPMQEMK